MAYRKLGFANYINLVNEGDFIEGNVNGVATVNTAYGTTEFLNLQTKDRGDVGLVITAGLASHPWADMVGQQVKIVLNGVKRNEKTGRDYKDYDVYVDDSYLGDFDVPFE